MTGPEHYQAAERCLSSVDDDSEASMALLAEAQVHATLALAAASALPGIRADGSENKDELHAWWWVAGTKPPDVQRTVNLAQAPAS